MQFVRAVPSVLALGLLAAPGAQAAGPQQPTRKPAAAAQRTGGCEAYGAGFVRVQGSDTCVKIGGRVRVETWFTPSKNAVTPAR